MRWSGAPSESLPVRAKPQGVQALGERVRTRRVAVWLALVVAGVAFSGCLQDDLVGKPVPPFEVVTDEGVRVNETTHLGTWLVLDLMATWCGPCVLEVAHLKEVQRQHGDQVVILSIGADPTESTTDLRDFGLKHGVTWPQALDRDGSVGRTMGLRTIPKLIVVDPEGTVVMARGGEVYPAAITRAIDPSAAPPEGSGATLLGGVLLALVVGLLAPFNPYRRLHRDSGRPLAAWLALLFAAGLVLLAWPFSGFVSGRATYGSLALGLASVGAVAWWLARARRKEPQAPAVGGNVLLEAGDRLYEWMPHLALALVLGLGGGGAWGFFLPSAAMVAGAALGGAARERLPERQREVAGLAGLGLAGAGLLAFGLRVVAVGLA